MMRMILWKLISRMGIVILRSLRKKSLMILLETRKRLRLLFLTQDLFLVPLCSHFQLQRTHSTSDTASFCPNFDSHDRAVHGISTRMFRNLWRVDGLQGSLTVFTSLSERLLKTLKSFAMRREKDDPARDCLKIATYIRNFSNI